MVRVEVINSNHLRCPRIAHAWLAACSVNARLRRNQVAFAGYATRVPATIFIERTTQEESPRRSRDSLQAMDECDRPSRTVDSGARVVRGRL